MYPHSAVEALDRWMFGWLAETLACGCTGGLLRDFSFRVGSAHVRLSTQPVTPSPDILKVCVIWMSGILANQRLEKLTQSKKTCESATAEHCC